MDAKTAPQGVTIAREFTLKGKRYKWLDEHFPEGSKLIKEKREEINGVSAHSNLISAQQNTLWQEENGFCVSQYFDIEDGYRVKVDLWLIGSVALTAMDLIFGVNAKFKAVEFLGDFSLRFQQLANQDKAIWDEFVSGDRHQKAAELDRLRKGEQSK